MQPMTPSSRAANPSALTPRAITLCCIVGSVALMLGGCVSPRTYDAAKQDMMQRLGKRPVDAIYAQNIAELPAISFGA